GVLDRGRGCGADAAAKRLEPIEPLGGAEEELGLRHRGLLAPREGLVPEDLAPAEVDDRLEREPKAIERAVEADLETCAIAGLGVVDALEALRLAFQARDLVELRRARDRLLERLVVD